MSVEFCCPIHREPLDRSDPTRWVGVGHGEAYPVVEGIPILLPDRAERDRIAKTDWDNVELQKRDAVDFYNEAKYEERYSRATHDDGRAILNGLLDKLPSPGPVLEVGSGRGPLQGIGQDYTALDYAFTLLRRNVDPKHHRVCGTAERLPFFDETFAFIYSVDTLEHVPKANLAFEEIHRVLKPGGVAFLLPAWHCVQYVCDGLAHRPYSDLTFRQRLVKFSLPMRKLPAAKAIAAMPARVARRIGWWLSGAKPTAFRFSSLKPDYEHFWESDFDACSRLDSHEGVLFFKSRGYELLSPNGGTIRQLLTRHEPVTVRKPITAAG
ncbi:MAG: methyltransferase domain-containing protein [Anaerolineae bacterium]|nr:methyltransferase domain-containing protein [Phycisphaerae bacterium]